MDSTTVFETVRRGSTPWRGTRLLDEPSMFSECAGFARDSAKVEDQVRFLAGALTSPIRVADLHGISPLFIFLHPDGNVLAVYRIGIGEFPVHGSVDVT